MRAKIKTRTKLVVDSLIFFGFLIAMDPRLTGVALHEWLTVAAMAAVVTHLLLSWDWIVQVTRRFFRSSAFRPRLNYVLNALLFIDMTLIMYTGLAISESFMPYFGLQLPRNFSMRSLHDLTANFFILLLGLHIGLHWNWIVETFKRHVIQPVSNLRFSKQSSKKPDEVEAR